MKENKILAEQIMEIRYPAFGELFDMRGYLSELLRKEMKFSDWGISRNRIDVRNHKDQEKATEKAFISFVNCGYISLRPPTENYFNDNASKFIRIIFDIISSKISVINRIGVRSKFILPTELDFKNLNEQCKKRLLEKKDIFSEILDAEIIDIGINLNFKKSKDFFNIRVGPMENDQMKIFFSFHDDLPKIGVYFDIDYFQENLKPDVKNISQLINHFASNSWEKLYKIQNLTLK